MSQNEQEEMMVMHQMRGQLYRNWQKRPSDWPMDYDAHALMAECLYQLVLIMEQISVDLKTIAERPGGQKPA